MVKILVILPAVSVSVCWKRKLQINNQALNHLSSQRWKAHGNKLIASGLSSGAVLLTVVQSQAELSRAELGWQCLPSSCLSSSSRPGQSWHVSLVHCSGIWYIIQTHMHFDNSTLNGHGIGVTPTSFTGHPSHRARWTEKEECTGLWKSYIYAKYIYTCIKIVSWNPLLYTKDTY